MTRIRPAGTRYLGRSPRIVAPTATATAFAPTDVTGLKVWLKADSLGLADGTAVSSWADSSGLSNHFTQATGANQPICKTGIINALPVVRFMSGGGAQHFLSATLSAQTAAEAFIVVQIAADPPLTSAEAGLWTFKSTNISATFFPFTDGTVYDGFATTARKTTVNPTPSLAAAFRLYNVISVSGEWTSKLDTTQLFTTATNTVAFATTALLGKSDGSGSGDGYLRGDVAELIIFDNKISAGNRTAIEAYLKAKYALTGF